MEGLFAIAEAIERSRAKGEAPVLATLVRVLGSGFRAPGARMLVQADGDCIGDLSGGCLDGDVVGRAASCWFMTASRSSTSPGDLELGARIAWRSCCNPCERVSPSPN